MVKTVRAFSMKKLSFLVSAAFVGTVYMAAPTDVGAQQLIPGLSALNPIGPFLFRFDEDGNGTITVGPNGIPTTLRGSLQPDPSQGPGDLPRLVLTYLLPEPVVFGDVSFAEVGQPPGVSDWIRFTNAAYSCASYGSSGQAPKSV